MAFLYQEFQASQDNFLLNQRIGLEFFFHGRGAALQKTPIGMFRSLLYQIYTKIPLVRLPIQTAFKEKKSFGEAGTSWEWQCKELQDLFSNALIDSAKLWKITIFVDALDEAGSKVAKDLAMYFHDLNDKLAAKKGSSRICISCRHYPIVAANNSLEICVEDENHDDITKYVKHRLNCGIQGMKMVDLSIDEFQALEGTIVTRASGVFQWARLVVPLVVDLNQQGESLQYIYKELSKVPTKLGDVYEHIFREVIDRRNRTRTFHLMQWICLAELPLSVTELRFAIASDDLYIHPARESCKEAKDFVDTDARMERLITSLSGGLVEVKHHMSKTTVQFIHQSVNDFLLSGGLKELASSTDDIIGQSQGRLSKSCINYLRLEEVLVGGSELANHKGFDPTNISLRLENLPFLEYATKCWFLHAEKAESFGTSQQDLVQQLGSPPGPAFQTWVKIYRKIDQRNAKCPQLGSTLLHIASSSNLRSVVRIIQHDNANINGKDDAGNRALHYASRWGHKDLAEILIDAGADIGAKNRNDSTALEYAAGNGHEGMLGLLLHRGADVNESTGASGSALQAAATKGNRILINMLLEAGADVNAQGGQDGNALQAAAYRGHTAVIMQLLKAGADVNAQGGHYGNALQAAAYRGHATVVTKLLEAGADVNAQGGLYSNALQAVAYRGHAAVITQLLEAGADVNAQGGHYSNALQAVAAYRRHATVVMQLLGVGANVNAQGRLYSNALQAVAYRGHAAVITQLLKAGADVNAQGRLYSNALQAAAYRGHATVVMQLLKAGADVNVQGGLYSNALQVVAFRGHVTQPLEVGANVNVQGGLYGNALQAVAFRGHATVVTQLLEVGANVNAQGGLYGNALQAVAFRGLAAIITQLLKAGADVNAQGGHYGNALQAAAYRGHAAIVTQLLKAGANVNAQGGHYGNSLQAAAYRGHAAVITQLLEAGADVNAQGGQYNNALQAAAYRGHAAVVTQLLEARADVNLLNQFFTAIQHILSLNINAKAQVLLDRGAQIKAFHEGVEAHNEYIVKLALGNGMRTDVPCGWFKYALHTAAYNGDVAIVSLLLAQSRKELDLADCSGRTPFALAAREGHVPVLATLFKLGVVNVNSQDLTGRTPLWWASANGLDEAVAWLLCKNADLHIPDNDGVMPLAKALMEGHNLIIKTLEGHALYSTG
jgi:ankyrin repeat protein